MADRKTLHPETRQHQSLRIGLLYSMPLSQDADFLRPQERALGSWSLLSLLVSRPVHLPQCKQTLLTFSVYREETVTHGIEMVLLSGSQLGTVSTHRGHLATLMTCHNLREACYWNLVD